MKKIHGLIKEYIIQVKEVIGEMSLQNNYEKVKVFLDIIYSSIVYRSSPVNYLEYGFKNMNHNNRKSYITYGHIQSMIKKYNISKGQNNIDDKLVFAKVFKESIGRDFIDFNNTNLVEFQEFVADKEQIIAKPANEGQGRGVTKIKVSDFDNIKKLYEFIINIEPSIDIVEDYIVQHADLNDLYSKSVNTLRIITVNPPNQPNQPNILFASLRVGNGESIDNFSVGGITSVIDIDTGKLKYHGSDKDYSIYEYHPLSGKKIKGFKVPYWEESKQLITNSAKRLSGMGYIGWDIAITENGPVLIEANTSPGYNVIQMPVHIFEKKGVKEKIERWL